jgi:hypothetical protein
MNECYEMRHVIGPPHDQASANSASLPLFGHQYSSHIGTFRMLSGLQGYLRCWKVKSLRGGGDVVEYDYVML